MTIRRTKDELATFKQIVAEYMAEGAPRWFAEEQAWSVIVLDRQIKAGRLVR